MPTIQQTAAGTYFLATTSGNVQLGSLPIVGNAVAVAVAIRGSGGSVVSSMSDNQGVGNVYTYIGSITSSVITQADAEIWWCQTLGTVGVSPFTVSVTYSNGTMGGQGVAAIEIAGAASVDKIGTANDGGSNVSSATVTAAGANAGTQDVVLTILALSTAHSTSVSLTNPPNSGYTTVYDGDPTSGTSTMSVGAKAVSAVETSSANWTWTTAGGFAAVIATFRGSVAVSTFGPMPKQLYVMP